MKHILLGVLCTITIALLACTTPAAVEEQTENSNQDYFLISLPKEIWQSRFPDLEGEVNILEQIKMAQFRNLL